MSSWESTVNFKTNGQEAATNVSIINLFDSLKGRSHFVTSFWLFSVCAPPPAL